MDLTPQQWANVKQLFDLALEKTPTERSAFLAGATQDSAIRQEVERLLAHHVESGGFLSKPVLAEVSAVRARSQGQSFSPGDVVAERFRISRFIARGGMGEVYEAEDLDLRERVALKSIRSELVNDARTLERFKREVHLARKVTHPNVCRIYDLFRHSGTGSGASVVFVAMELLEGQTLAELMQSKARLSVEEAAPIALQMASGLGAAHAVGVLHRDFKPGNVLLVPTAKGIRAVVTDFGLALRSDKDASVAHPVTGPGEMLGTPAYMSPEQVEGKELKPASDVYSLGLVLYQMVTGTRAFDAGTPLSMAVRRVKEDPPPPRIVVPTLDRRWESVILRCLARDPSDRFQTGDEVADALRSDKKSGLVWNSRRRQLLVTLALAIIVAFGAILAWRISHRFRPGANETVTTQSIVRRPSVAVLPFHNLSGRTDTEWVATALPEMLTAELTAGGKLRTFPGENVARASADLRLTGKQTLARDTLTHLREYLGSDYVVLGSYLDQGSAPEAQIRLDLWLQDTRTGEITATVSEKGGQSDLDDLATRAGAELRRRLALADVTPTEAVLVRASLPSSPNAVRLYSKGLARLRVADAMGARDLLQRAVAADPNYALGHLALADAWAMMGYDSNARDESKKARELSSGLSHEESLWIEGRDWELNRKWDKAVESYRTLFEFFPDNLEYGLRLAAAQKSARNADEALATLTTLRRQPPPNGDDVRIDMQEAEVLELKGAYKEEQSAADAAARRAREIGANMLLAHALNQKARSLEEQGKLEDAIASAEEATRIAESAGERVEMARALTVVGIVRYDQGNFTEAANSHRLALELQREIGNQRGAATTLNNLANVVGAQGDFAGSAKMLREALLIFREIGDKHSAAAVLNNIATRTYRQGELKEAQGILREALATSREVGDQERASIALYNLGEVLHWEGDLRHAREMYEQARQLSEQIGDQSGVAYALFSLGELATDEADFTAARSKYNEALALRSKMGEQGNVEQTQLALVSLQVEEGHASETENAVRQARDEFRTEGLRDNEIDADILLTRILLLQGKVADAQKEITAIHGPLSKSQDFSVRLTASIAEAKVTAAAGKREEAIHILDETIANASRSGYLGFQLEAQLALAEIQLGPGKSAKAMRLLRKVQSKAQEHGYRLIANKASQIAGKSSGDE
ncbi:MAG TPA: tetratricopeptide repeat protein [Candidatus Sulfotelmatobacter sp.]|nr:tetratricopeptide repeat protein [Candidatus Sulfotelmatobacter sp.]